MRGPDGPASLSPLSSRSSVVEVEPRSASVSIRTLCPLVMKPSKTHHAQTLWRGMDALAMVASRCGFIRTGLSGCMPLLT